MHSGVFYIIEKERSTLEEILQNYSLKILPGFNKIIQGHMSTPILHHNK